MSVNSHSRSLEEQAITRTKKLLGSLELEIMEFMWQAGESTVQQVTKAINRKRPIAYTTVMTVMGHLVDKELLARTKEGRRYCYRVAQSRDEFLREISRRMVRTLVDDFGDLAIAQFLGEIDNVDADRLEQLRIITQESTGESGALG